MRSNKDALDEYVVQRLVEWSEWFVRGCNTGLGYSRKNILARLKEEGGVLINGTGPMYPPTNEAAEEIETLLRMLNEKIPHRAQVLRIHYLYPESYKIKAKRCGFKSTNYYQQLHLAHEWVKGYLCARKNQSF